MDLKALIAKAREEVGDSGPVPIEVAGELVDVAFRQVPGHVWADLTAQSAPRPGSVLDGNVGFNSDAVIRIYPLTHVTVAGEPVEADDWAALLEVIASPSIKRLAASLWGINQLDPAKRIAELGKARAGVHPKKRRSPANSGSRSGASKGGSPQK